MARRDRIIFTDSGQSDKGIMSLILGVLCSASVIFSLIYSYIKQGELPPERFGAALIVTLVFAACGIVLGMLARLDDDKRGSIPTAGIIINLIVVVALGFFLWIGLN